MPQTRQHVLKARWWIRIYLYVLFFLFGVGVGTLPLGIRKSGISKNHGDIVEHSEWKCVMPQRCLQRLG